MPGDEDPASREQEYSDALELGHSTGGEAVGSEGPNTSVILDSSKLDEIPPPTPRFRGSSPFGQAPPRAHPFGLATSQAPDAFSFARSSNDGPPQLSREQLPDRVGGDHLGLDPTRIPLVRQSSSGAVAKGGHEAGRLALEAAPSPFLVGKPRLSEKATSASTSSGLPGIPRAPSDSFKVGGSSSSGALPIAPRVDTASLSDRLAYSSVHRSQQDHGSRAHKVPGANTDLSISLPSSYEVDVRLALKLDVMAGPSADLSYVTEDNTTEVCLTTW